MYQTSAGKSGGFWGCGEEPNRHGGPHARNPTPSFDNRTVARWVTAPMKCNNPTLPCVIYCSQPAEGTAVAQTLMHGGRSYHLLDDILPPRAQNMIDDISEASDDDVGTLCLEARSIPTTKTRFQHSKRSFKSALLDSRNTRNPAITVHFV